VHVPVVPRYAGAPREYWEVRVDEWIAAPYGGAEKMDALCGRLQVWISGHEGESRSHTA